MHEESQPQTGKKIQVLVADDSPIVRRLVVSYLEEDPAIDVIATAEDGEEAVRKVIELGPDVVTMDLEMPKMSGLAALKRIMGEKPTPVLVLSGVSGRAAGQTRLALETGAVDFLLKYSPGINFRPEDLRQEIVAKVHSVSTVRVIRSIRRRLKPGDPGQEPLLDRRGLAARLEAPLTEPWRRLSEAILVIGASTGGPEAIRAFLEELPKDLRAAILIVQHMPPAFTGILGEQLSRHLKRDVREAVDGEVIEPGIWRIAPGGLHLLLGPTSRTQLSQGEKIRGHRPSIDVTMQSVARVYGTRARGVLLTGMGDDGAEGLRAIQAHGGVAYAQNPETCVVAGMPQKAIAAGVVDTTGSPKELANAVAKDLASRPEGDGGRPRFSTERQQ